ncbi:MAG: hypothetical protein GZ088_01280 [Acidipila sp.]|nr:hypothetical protein [Acidipila sp.]
MNCTHSGSKVRYFTRASALAVVCLAGLGALAQPGPAGQKKPAPRAVITEKFQRTLPLAWGGTFSLANVNGSIEVEGWSREEVQITALQTRAADLAEGSGVKIEVLARADGIAVRTIYPEGEGVDVGVEYHVRVPHRVRLESVATVNGTVRVRAVEGAGALRTVNGNIEFYDGAGHFDARSTNGNIYMELGHLGDTLAEGDAPATIETINGTVVLALPAQTNSDLDIRSLNGDFSSELPVERSASAGGRQLRCRLGTGGRRLRIQTMNGAVRLRMAGPIV